MNYKVIFTMVSGIKIEMYCGTSEKIRISNQIQEGLSGNNHYIIGTCEYAVNAANVLAYEIVEYDGEAKYGINVIDKHDDI